MFDISALLRSLQVGFWTCYDVRFGDGGINKRQEAVLEMLGFTLGVTRRSTIRSKRAVWVQNSLLCSWNQFEMIWSWRAWVVGNKRPKACLKHILSTMTQPPLAWTLDIGQDGSVLSCCLHQNFAPTIWVNEMNKTMEYLHKTLHSMQKDKKQNKQKRKYG